MRNLKPSSMSQKIGAVLVVGGGIGGIQASLDLAESGYKVYLVESSPAIGGVMAQLDKTFPTNDCSMCILSPKLVECGRHRNIELLTYSDLAGIEGEPGRFKFSVRKRARSVNEGLCTGCGICQEKCPWKTDSEFEVAIGKRKAIYIPYSQAVPNIPVIDRELCVYFRKGTCRACEKFCPSHAIDFEQQDEIVELEAGSIILAPGFDKFEAGLKPEYGYGRFPNVVTSIQFERILCASGPFQGHLQRPSDGREPKSIAFIQCVGSRDVSGGRPYCSSVCCTYAIKEAIIAKEHAEDVKPTIFYIDMRTYGKDFDKYLERAKAEYGVRLIRSRISAVEQNFKTENLMIRYEAEEGGLFTEEFELVVLSVGLSPPREAVELADKLGIELNRYNFVKTSQFKPTETSQPGIFVCGAFSGPKDIPDTVMQASAAAANSSVLLSSARHTLIREKEYPPERDVTGEPPRIGAFICHCGINIGGYVDVPQVVEYAKTLPHVAYAEDNLYTCSQDTQDRIRAMIKEHNLNRVVVASCTPRTHEPLFQETIREAGLNRYLFEMANIRDQCSWVHMHEPEKATEKAKDLVKMAVAKARLIEPLKELSIGVVNKGLVIGGGMAGMTAALELADQGFECFLIEREGELGGNLRRVYYTLEGGDVREFLENTVRKVKENELINVFTDAKIKEINGFVGNFKTTVGSNGKEYTLEHGAIILACGGGEYRPNEYLYAKHERVVTQLELEQRLATHSLKDGDLSNVVMIQCVGSRNDESPYCSRICCGQAIKNALKIKERNAEANIYILYRDMRTYGFNEEFYREARSKGVIFMRYDEDHKPEVRGEGEKLEIKVLDPILKEQLAIEANLLVLSVGVVPSTNREELSKMLKVPCNEDGFFLEAHVKLRPVEFATDGILLCGLAHSPKPISENISQAQAAACKAAMILAKGYVSAEPIICQVDEEKCIGCGLCESICAFKAIRLVSRDGENKAEIIPASCKGCGLCAASCPALAITHLHFAKEEVRGQIEALALVRELAER
jgi:heterodisulfide reductase subunit A